MHRRKLIISSLALSLPLAGCTGTEEDGEVGGSGGDQDNTDEQTTVQDNADEQSAESANPESRTAEAIVGEVVQDDNLSMVVGGVSRTESVGDYQDADAGNEFVIVRLVVKNRHSSEFASFSSLLQTRIVDSESYTYDRAFVSTKRNLGEGKLAPGEVSRGDIVFEVPKDATNLELEFDFQAFGFFNFDRVTIDLEQEADSVGDLQQNLQVPILSNGDSDSFNGTETTVNGIETAEEFGEYTVADEGNEYLIVDISVTNNTGDEHRVSILGQMDLKDGSGFRYTVDIGGYSALDRKFEQGSPIEDGQTRRGKIAYQVEEGLKPLYWTFDFGLFAEGGKSFWQVQ